MENYSSNTQNFQKSGEEFNASCVEITHTPSAIIQYGSSRTDTISEISAVGKAPEIFPQKYKREGECRKIVRIETRSVPNNVGSTLQRIYDIKVTWGSCSKRKSTSSRDKNTKGESEMWDKV